MVKKITDSIAELRLRQFAGKQRHESERFNDFFGKSESVLVILDANNLRDANELINYLIAKGKIVTIFATVKDFNQFLLMNKCRLFEYTLEEINKIGLPTRYLIKRFKRENYDIIINLESHSNIFFRAIVQLCNTKYRIGGSDSVARNNFNIQIISSKNKLSCPQIINTLNLFT